jgi:pimeloyl-ACP methyl ester carboxylesterase
VAVPEAAVNGVNLFYELEGSGEPLVLVHGSWQDATSWRLVIAGLAERFRVLAYDRRGYSRSRRTGTPSSVDKDGDDLAALLEALDLAPAHVVTNSYGGNIALRLATRRPDLFRSLCCHEPPLLSVVDDDDEAQRMLVHGARSMQAIGKRIAEGDHEGAARQFVEEVIMGPGAWEHALPAETRAMMTLNAPALLGQLQDPNANVVDSDALATVDIPVRLTMGGESAPVLARVIDRLVELIPGASREAIDGAGHLPQLTTPERYVAAIRRAAQDASTRRSRDAVSSGVSERRGDAHPQG